MNRIMVFSVCLMFSIDALADDKKCSGLEHRKYIKEVVLRPSPAVCKSNTMLLEFLLNSNYDKGDRYLSGIGISIADADQQLITQYNLKIYPSKNQPGAHLCISESYINGSHVQFYFAEKTASTFESGNKKVSTHSIKGTAEACPIGHIIKKA